MFLAKTTKNRVATNAEIKACLGEDAANYAANKHRGGINGNKGSRYEEMFLAHKIVEAAVSLVDDPNAANPHVQGQVCGFVDDARVSTETSTDYFQLKNKASVSWTAGPNPIATDFSYQLQLSLHLKEPHPTTSVVVPDSSLAAHLHACIPETIRAHSLVHTFPWYGTLNKFVLESSDVRALLCKLANIEAPSHDVLSGVFSALLMAFNGKPDGATVTEVLDHAGAMFPGQLRSRPATVDWGQYLRPDFVEILAKIVGLHYSAERGFLHWSAFGTSGVFGSYVLSNEFDVFQNEIIQICPKTFEEFEELLP